LHDRIETLSKTHRLLAQGSQASMADLLLRAKKTIRWSLRLGNKLRTEAPLPTAAGVFATLTAQISILLAFLLPIKVIVMLGAERMTGANPAELQGLDQQSMIILLSIGAVLFFGLHLLASYVEKLAISRGAKQLLTRTDKLVLFENQDEVATIAYKQFTTALSGGIFVILSLLLLLWLYPLIPLLLFVFTSLVFLLLIISGRYERVRNQLENNLEAWLTPVATTGFLLAFSLLVADFMIGQPPPLTPAILALLLTRRLSKKTQTSISSLVKLARKRAQIDALFFNQQVLLKDLNADKTIWPLLLPEQRSEWVPQVLASVIEGECRELRDCHWWPLAESHIVALHCEFNDGPDLLIKLFDSSCTSQALHEATLLSDAPALLPAPVWRGMTELQGYHCHIFQLPNGARPLAYDIDEAQFEALRHELLQTQPPANLVTRYTRSHPIIDQRLGNKLLLRLKIATDTQTEQSLLKASQRLASWRVHLQDKPLAFSLPFEARNLLESADGKILVLHWGNWVLEPCGYDWPIDPETFAGLAQVLESARLARTDMASSSAEQLLLVALSARFEQSLVAAQYDVALALLGAINECLDRLEKCAPACVSDA
jgi:DNA-directed RNA polymerase subunit L